jgi:hypothetical protein
MRFFTCFSSLRFLTGLVSLSSVASFKHPSTATKVRQAASGDLDGVMKFVLSAMHRDPTWDHRFPHRKQYREDERKYQTSFFNI